MGVDSSIYEKLYAGSNYGAYPKGSRRLDQVHKWVKKYVPWQGTVFDFGCGRGHLLRKLLTSGYKCCGYEPCGYLIGHDLAGLPLRGCAIYTALYDPWWLPPSQFDCVVASDVLEHLPTEEEALDLLRKLCGFARKFVVITVGVGPSNASANLPGVDYELHTVLRAPGWWRAQIASHVDIVAEASIKKSALFCGKVKANG